MFQGSQIVGDFIVYFVLAAYNASGRFNGMTFEVLKKLTKALLLNIYMSHKCLYKL